MFDRHLTVKLYNVEILHNAILYTELQSSQYMYSVTLYGSSPLQGFREGRFQVLVATDVAARGLDIPEVDLVIQCEPPKVS